MPPLPASARSGPAGRTPSAGSSRRSRSSCAAGGRARTGSAGWGTATASRICRRWRASSSRAIGSARAWRRRYARTPTCCAPSGGSGRRRQPASCRSRCSSRSPSSSCRRSSSWSAGPPCCVSRIWSTWSPTTERAARMPMSGAVHRARVATSGAVLAERLRLAHTAWTRLQGLLGTKRLDPGDGLWLRPCRQIHMFGMRYAVDAVFLDEHQRVVRALSELSPWRVSPRVADAESVLELPAGTVARTRLAKGAQVVIEGGPVASRAGAGGRAGTALCNIALAVLYSLFVAAHVSRAHGPIDVARVVSYAIIVQMTILAILFVARRPSADTSDRPLDWAIGIGGTFLPLLLRRTDPPAGLAWLGGPVQLVGASAVAVAAVYLGRSFGLVAANRGVQLGGAYRLVRHPMYGAHALGYLGYVLTYPSAANVMVVGATLLLLNARAVAEERILARDPAYREYLQRLPWRFLPYVY